MTILARTGGTAFDSNFLTLAGVLVAIFIGILIIVFLRKRTFPMISLFFIRLFKGRFSYEYLEFFKKNDLRNPLNNCIRDEITLHFSVFFKQLKGALEFTSDVPIEFKEIPFMTPYHKIIKENGLPDCINIARFDGNRVKVIGYNETFQQRRMKSLLYFIEDLFVMGEFVFSEAQRMDPVQVREALAKKYLDGEAVNADVFYISAPLPGNILNYHDNGFFASVKYLYRGDRRMNEILNNVFTNPGQNGQAFKQAMI